MIALFVIADVCHGCAVWPVPRPDILASTVKLARSKLTQNSRSTTKCTHNP